MLSFRVIRNEVRKFYENSIIKCAVLGAAKVRKKLNQPFLLEKVPRYTQKKLYLNFLLSVPFTYTFK